MMLLLDVGGSVTRIATADKDGAIVPHFFPTDPSFDAALANIKTEGDKLFTNKAPRAVVMGVTGRISPNGVIVRSPNLPSWEGRDMKSALEKLFNTEAYVLNDAVMGAMGEAHAGAGRNADTLLYITLGTGVGAARVVKGMPDLSVGSETGHQYLMADGKLVELEDLVSGKALRARYGKAGEDIHDEKIWDECARIFAVGLYNTVLHFIPDRVVIGGSLVKDGSLSVEKIAEHLALIAGRLPALPEIRRAEQGDAVGLYGAQAYARHMLS